MRRILLSCALCSLVACSSANAGDDTEMPPGDDYNMKTPQVIAIAPGRVAVGDVIQVVGQDFVDPDHGVVRVQFAGTFTDEFGEEEAYNADIPLDWQNAGIGQFMFGPTVLFSSYGDRVGTFHGSIRVINHRGAAEDDSAEEKASDSLDTEISVAPSIIVDEMRSIDGSCAQITDGTTADNNVSLGFRAIGLGTATTDKPFTFKVTTTSPLVNAQFVRNEWYQQWPFQPTVYANSVPGNFSMQTTIDSGAGLTIEPQSREQIFDINPPVTIGQQQYGNVKLSKLWTGELDGPGPAYANFLVEVTTFDGQYAARVVTWKVHNQAEILPFNGTAKLVERYAPEQTEGCFPGGDIGIDLQYSEGSSISKTRSVSFRWDVNVGASLGLQVGAQLGTGIQSPVQFGVNASVSFTASWSNTFGVDTSESVSSETHESLTISRHILPGYFGTCYRQVERLERAVPIVVNNSCGVSAEIGDATLTDWHFSFDVASGPMCPPDTDLPPAQVFE